MDKKSSQNFKGEKMNEDIMSAEEAEARISKIREKLSKEGASSGSFFLVKLVISMLMMIFGGYKINTIAQTSNLWSSNESLAGVAISGLIVFLGLALFLSVVLPSKK